ncbi:hypothetical protein [Oceanobacillus sojae]
MELRRKYDEGEITAEQFLDRLFSTREADRRRRKIVAKNEKLNKKLQKA